MSGPLGRILRESGENLLSTLAEELSPTDLQTLLMEVYRLRATNQNPPKLLEQHQENRFTRPSPMDPRTALAFDSFAFSLAAPQFGPIELAPLAPLGTTAAVTNISQNNIVSTARNVEAMADPTNAMALECAVRRKKLGKTDRVRLCCSQRVTRAQPVSGPNSWAHFRLFALVSAGRDEGSYKFEVEEVTNHISFYLRLLQAWPNRTYTTKVLLTNFGGEALGQAHEAIAEKLGPQTTVMRDTERQTGRTYYDGFCFQIWLTDNQGEETFIADGGITDWTQRLLSNKKERFMISGFGSERFCSLFPPTSQT